MGKYVEIEFGKESVISMAPPEVKEWGPWQFPALYKSVDNVLSLSFHKAADSYSAYGSAQCQYISTDNGASWELSDFISGLPLSDGKMLRPAKLAALDVKSINLPEPVARCKYCYVKDALLYDIEQVDEAYKKWYNCVITNGRGILEEIRVNVPGYLMRVSTGLLIQPFFYTPYYFRRNSNSIMAVSYHPMNYNGKVSTYFDALYFESCDNGKTFDLISTIPFRPPYQQINDSENCQGWLEPSLCFIDENTAFTLLRTTCVKGVSPLYISWSYDGCKTWKEPEYFDNIGVFPQAVKLDNDVVLAGYGRPGLYVRARVNGNWDDRVEVVSPGELMKDTCSYCAIAPIGSDRALIVYSRFDVKDENGRFRKAIVCREISVNVKKN